MFQVHRSKTDILMLSFTTFIHLEEGTHIILHFYDRVASI
jgi:hypothetical protein